MNQSQSIGYFKGHAWCFSIMIAGLEIMGSESKFRHWVTFHYECSFQEWIFKIVDGINFH